MTKIVSAYEARTNFGELLNLVYYQGENVVVTKSGKIMAQITKPKTEIKLSRKKTYDKLWARLRALSKEGKQIDMVEFIRKDRDSGHKIHY